MVECLLQSGTHVLLLGLNVEVLFNVYSLISIFNLLSIWSYAVFVDGCVEGLGKGLGQFSFYVEIRSMDLLSSCPQLRKGETIRIIQPEMCKKIL